MTRAKVDINETKQIGSDSFAVFSWFSLFAWCVCVLLLFFPVSHHGTRRIQELDFRVYYIIIVIIISIFLLTGKKEEEKDRQTDRRRQRPRQADRGQQ